MTGAQQLDYSIDRVAFGDTPKIELDTIDIEGDCARLAIEDDVTRTYTSPDAGQFPGIGHAILAAEESPGLHQRPDGDVESAIGFVAVTQRPLDEIEELFVDGDRMPGPIAVEA